MRTKDFSYHLPKHLIAQQPKERRTDSRLLVMDRFDGRTVHTQFRQFHRYLRPGDVLVLNDTAVIPARLLGEKEGTGAVVEVLLLREVRPDEWECLVGNARKVKLGTPLVFGDGALRMRCTHVGKEGLRTFSLHYEGSLDEILEHLGDMPLPPYIHETLEDPERYQTVYRREKGSAAAPTAGLHFTEDYLRQIEETGVDAVFLTLHVGLGTFRPVKVERVEEHHMHEEYYSVPETTAARINRARREGGRVVAVGTTSVRTLETVADADGFIRPGSGSSDLFIYPGYPFRAVDAMLTNFHLPESTLLMMVSAFAGRKHVLSVYEEAIEKEYRFYSFGDAMFLTDKL